MLSSPNLCGKEPLRLSQRELSMCCLGACSVPKEVLRFPISHRALSGPWGRVGHLPGGCPTQRSCEAPRMRHPASRKLWAPAPNLWFLKQGERGGCAPARELFLNRALLLQGRGLGEGSSPGYLWVRGVAPCGHLSPAAARGSRPGWAVGAVPRGLGGAAGALPLPQVPAL